MMRNNQRTESEGSSHYFGPPSNLPVPQIDRWASETSSQMFGSTSADYYYGRQKSSVAQSNLVADNKNNKNITSSNSNSGSVVATTAEKSTDSNNNEESQNQQSSTSSQQHQQLQQGGVIDPNSPFHRLPPPPPPFFDITTTTRQRFIAKIMRWYQWVEEWCKGEKKYAKFDRDRLIVAPPPRPPLFVEHDSAVFHLNPQIQNMSPYDVDNWAEKCHRWWQHVHRCFHELHVKMIGQSICEHKAKMTETLTLEQYGALMKEIALVDNSRDDELIEALELQQQRNSNPQAQAQAQAQHQHYNPYNNHNINNNTNDYHQNILAQQQFVINSVAAAAAAATSSSSSGGVQNQNEN